MARPSFHFTANRGWINDPHGLTFDGQRYHLFFQHVPDSMEWAPGCHWGHAVAPDLVHWEERPFVLAPDAEDGGVWSGCVSVDAGNDPIAFYTAVSVPDFGIGRVRTARPIDGRWETWEKGDVVATLPDGVDAIAFRDPFVFRDAACWRMLLGVAKSDGTAAAASFSSTDRESWTFDGIAAERSSEETEPVWTGSLWECPQLFEIDGMHILVTSIWDADLLYYVAYAVGDYEDGHFVGREWHRLTYGDNYYAPSFFRDRDGLPCLVFWLRGARDDADGWVGAHSIPFRLSMRDGALHLEPHPDVRAAVPSRFSILPSTDGAPASIHGIGTWDPRDHDLEILGVDGTMIRLSVGDGGLLIAEGGNETVVKGGDEGAAQVVVDGPIVEVVGGSYAAAFSSSADLRVRAVARH